MEVVEIRAMRASDWPDVRGIYAEGIASGHATFETKPPEWREWDAGHSTVFRLVAVVAGQVVGWAAASPVSERCCYAGVIEHSVYVSQDNRGRGVGHLLLHALVAASEQNGIWTMQTGIFPENVASVSLHEACGFRLVGRRERLGQLKGEWRDVLLFERRSP